MNKTRISILVTRVNDHKYKKDMSTKIKFLLMLKLVTERKRTGIELRC